MKQITLIMVIILGLLLPIKAQDNVDKVIDKTSEGITTMYNDTKSLSPSIQKAIKQISENLNVGANHVWELLVKQQKINSICILIVLLLTGGSIIHFWYRYNQVKPIGVNKYGNDEYENVPGAIITGIIAGIGIIISGIHFNTMLTGFYNPEFGALRDITKLAITFTK